MTKNTDFILEKAFSEFLNSSYAEVSTNDLERATGLTRGAIYYTYKSKEELFRAVIERFVLDKQHVLRKTGFHEDAAKWISLKEYLETKSTNCSSVKSRSSRPWCGTRWRTGK